MFTVSATGCFANDSTCTCWRRISRAVFRNTFTVRGIVRAGPVHTITGRTSTDKALIFTLVSRIHIIRFISLAVGNFVIAVTIPQKTNSSNLIGLFGTVWGIINSFNAIAATQSNSLSAMAPGIAEALFTTAFGLIAAIPAVVAYNKISSDIDRYAKRLENFQAEFSSILSREIDDTAIKADMAGE